MANDLVKYHAALQRVTDNAVAIYGVLDAAKGPVRVAQIRATLGITDPEYRRARQHLTAEIADDVYITQDGLVLRKYVHDGGDQRFWHLAWCLGLLEVSGQQLLMDEDMLEKAPGALIKMLSEGKLRDANRLSALQTTARKRIGTLAKLADMYRRVDKALGFALLPHVSSKNWKDGMREIRKQLKAVS